MPPMYNGLNNMPYYMNPNNYLAQTQPQTNNTYEMLPSMAWVQGEVGAQAYPTAAGSTIFLFDSEENMFYLKSVDKQTRIPSTQSYVYFPKDDASSIKSYLSTLESRQQPTNDSDSNQFITQEQFSTFSQNLAKQFEQLTNIINNKFEGNDDNAKYLSADESKQQQQKSSESQFKFPTV